MNHGFFSMTRKLSTIHALEEPGHQEKTHERTVQFQSSDDRV
jgi:hypothetical protein